MTLRAENGLLTIAWAAAVMITGLYGVFRMTQVAPTSRRILDWLPVCGAVWIGLAVAEMRAGIPPVLALGGSAFVTAMGAAAIWLRTWLTAWRYRYWEEEAARERRSAYRPTDFSIPPT
jgi:hypothetical protein